MERLGEVLAELERRTDIRGAVLDSAKTGVFNAGADVNEIGSVTDGEAAAEAVRAGQALMDRIEGLPFPVVASIGGVCLGGGTELALACDARVGSDHPRFQLGLPEVNLGILPVWGGATRLPRLIGLPKALDFVLRGRPVDAKRAERLGILDRAVAHGELEKRSLKLLHALIEGERPRRRKPSFFERLLSGNPLGRALLFSQARKRVLGQTKGHYPAPLAILDVLRRGHASKQRSLELEVEHAKTLLPGAVSKNLVHLFFLNENAKKDPGVTDDAVEPRPFASAALLGAGLSAARSIFERLLKRRRLRMTCWELERKMALITTTLDFSGFKNADVVFEAIVEDIEIKKSVFRQLEPVVSESCLIASNTSTLSVSDMQSVLERPERMAGFHFFNPVDRMPLIEVIRGDKTDNRATASLVALAKKLGKTPVVVKDGPGFLVNRILGPYLNEAGHLFEECGDIAAIDRAFVAFGMPMGPLRLFDEVGLMVAEAARCLDEGIVCSPGELDLAMVMGTGFPPFHGGLLRYADHYGVARIVDDLAKWSGQLGSRFDPTPSLRDRKAFYRQ